MTLNISKIKTANNNFKREVLDEGTYPARVVQIIDMGVQPQRAFQGVDKPPKHELKITYELSDEFMKDKDGNVLEDKPRWLSEDIPLSARDNDKAKSTKRYNALDPEDNFRGDYTQLIGAPCMVTVVHGENKKNPAQPYENIGNVSTMRKKQADVLPDLVNEPRVFVLDEPDLDVFNSFPDWIKEKIKSNLEYAGSPLERLLSGSKDEGKATPAPKAKKPVEKPVEAAEGEEEDDTPW